MKIPKYSSDKTRSHAEDGAEVRLGELVRNQIPRPEEAHERRERNATIEGAAAFDLVIPPNRRSKLLFFCF